MSKATQSSARRIEMLFVGHAYCFGVESNNMTLVKWRTWPPTTQKGKEKTENKPKIKHRAKWYLNNYNMN